MIKMGIVGTGATMSIAHYHAEGYKKDPRCQVAAVYDINREAAEKCRELPGNILLATGAKELPEALEDFLRWIGEEPARIYAWSDSDKKQLYQECFLKGIWEEKPPKQLRRWIDFQRIYTRLLGLSKRNRISLKNAIGGIEVNFAGSQHSAADDAENSAVLLTLLHDKEAFEERTRITRELMNAASAPP